MTKTPSTTATDTHEADTQSKMLAPDTVLTLEIPWSTVEPVYQKISRKVAKRVKIDGFRKGKVPAHLAKQVVGTEQAIELTLEEVIPPMYVKLITENKKHPLGNPEFHPESVEIGKTWKLHVHIGEKPVFELGDWKKVAKTAKESYLKEKARVEKDKDHKSAIKEPVAEEEKQRSDQLGMIFGALVTTIRPQIAQVLVKQEATSQLKQLGEQLERFNLTFESFLEQRKMTQEQLTNQVAGEALGRIQLAFIIDAIVEDLKLQPTAAEIEAELAQRTADIQDYYSKNPEASAALENRLAQQKVESVLLAL